MDWKKISVSSGAKLFRVHHFTYMNHGGTFLLEIDEYANGTFTGHGEHSTDKSTVLESVTAPSLEECLSLLTRSIK